MAASFFNYFNFNGEEKVVSKCSALGSNIRRPGSSLADLNTQVNDFFPLVFISD